MNKRIVIDEVSALQVASLAQSRVLKVTKPQGDQSIVLDLSDQSVKLDFSAIAGEKMTFMQAGTRLVLMDACRNEKKLKPRTLDLRRDMIPEGVAAHWVVGLPHPALEKIRAERI